MQLNDSSTSATASSPFSTRSTNASSPETIEQKPLLSRDYLLSGGVGGGAGYSKNDGFAQSMQAMLGTFANGLVPFSFLLVSSEDMTLMIDVGETEDTQPTLQISNVPLLLHLIIPHRLNST